jgi:hypothetical protein
MRTLLLFFVTLTLCSCRREPGPSTFTKECDSMRDYPTVRIKPLSVSDSDSIVVRIFEAGNGFKDERTGFCLLWTLCLNMNMIYN